MAEIFKKITGLFSDSKTRILALIGAVIIVSLIIWGISAILGRMHGPLGPETAASVTGGPNIESIPGGWDRPSSPEYVKQVKERNIQEAKKAQKQGTSAIPTITEATNITEELDPSKISGGAGFSTLKRLETADSELKTITAKCKAVGALVYDNQGNTMGTVGPDGVVKDPCGKTVGTVGDDCNVRDANGSIVGKSSGTVLGSAVYDAQGRLIGVVGPDGQLRDLAGNVIGKVDEKGVVRDANGNIIATGSPGANDRLVYDENGNVIGIAGPDGTIRDASGKVIGTLGPDGIAKGLNGDIIGKAGSAQGKSLVYDKDGKLIGVVGPDGKVRDASGKVIGTVGPDGTVRNLKGEIIGKASATTAGAPVYDSSGRLIGTVGPDGVVRDANGKVIGTVGPDGVVRNAKGEVIGKAGAGGAAGVPVYDANGNLIGIAGPDGVVRDAKGNIVGKVDPKTGQVLDSQGKVIGKIAPNALAQLNKMGGVAQTAGAGAVKVPTGTPVYDKNGKLLGVVGPDGVVRDASGNVVGTVGPDGMVRNANGEVLGKAGSLPEGTLIYDDKGNVIGKVGADGLVRDANGNVMGAYDPVTGAVIDKQGRTIGMTAAKASQKKDPLAALAASASSTGKTPVDPNSPEAQLQLAKQRQEELNTQQQADVQRQQMQGVIGSQVSQLFTAWAAPTQQYVVGNPAEAKTASAAEGAAAGGAAAGGQGAVAGSVLIKAGTVMFGVLNTAVNTDQLGPVMVSIVSGPYKGAKLLGTVRREGEKALLSFNIMNYEKMPRTIAINAVAIDPNTARTAVSTDVDNHYLLRYGTLFASSFIQGYATALTTAGTTVTALGLGLSVQKATPDLSGKGKILVALGKVGEQYSSLMTPVFQTPPTVTVDSGTGVGLLFLSDVIG